MKLSIFTPSHDPKFLPETWRSLKDQPFDEWVIFSSAFVPGFTLDDRVKVVATSLVDNIGAIKHEACNHCCGDILLELDHDDLLAPHAIASVKRAFSDPAVQFTYSNCVEFTGDFANPPGYPYTPEVGWSSRPASTPDGSRNGLFEMVAFPFTAHSLRRILWAPNHLRAWRRSAYEKIGGHDSRLALADDHDLICRTYTEFGEAGAVHLDSPLYYQRVHEQNSQKTFNPELQRQANLSYLRHVEPMAKRWAKDHGLRALDLGGRIDSPGGYETVDLLDADVCCDLRGPWPFADSSVGVIRASHVLEHLPDPIHAMNEAWRVLAPGGFLFVEVPSATGKGAFRDPTHRSFWVDQSFWYYTNEKYARYIRPEFNGRFQNSRLESFGRDEVGPVVACDLIALKEGYKPIGPV